MITIKLTSAILIQTFLELECWQLFETFTYNVDVYTKGKWYLYTYLYGLLRCYT